MFSNFEFAFNTLHQCLYFKIFSIEKIQTIILCKMFHLPRLKTNSLTISKTSIIMQMYFAITLVSTFQVNDILPRYIF